MSLFKIVSNEILFRWKTSLIFVLSIATITGVLIFFVQNNAGLQREIRRSARDIGSNVVILPADVDQVAYHSNGGYSDETMPASVVQQLIEYKASLNHLIPTLERRSGVFYQGQTVNARIVGLSASIPMPGRPKAPMQRSIKKGEVQLGAVIAEKLEIGRDEMATVEIEGQPFIVQRVNRLSGSWQDGAVLMDLDVAQSLFQMPSRISRIEAIECTDEKCAETGFKPDVVLANELASITDTAMILRRDKIADARSGIRTMSEQNFIVMQTVLWAALIVFVISLATVNTYQRTTEVGIWRALGYARTKLQLLFVSRSLILTAMGVALGAVISIPLSMVQIRALFHSTGAKTEVEWSGVILISVFAIVLSILSTSIPAFVASQ